MDFTLSDGSTLYLDELCLHSILEYVLDDSVSLQSVACTSWSLNLATGAVAADGLFGCLKVRALFGAKRSIIFFLTTLLPFPPAASAGAASPAPRGRKRSALRGPVIHVDGRRAAQRPDASRRAVGDEDRQHRTQ